jgi:hypothetical protein
MSHALQDPVLQATILHRDCMRRCKQSMDHYSYTTKTFQKAGNRMVVAPVCPALKSSNSSSNATVGPDEWGAASGPVAPGLPSPPTCPLGKALLYAAGKMQLLPSAYCRGMEHASRDSCQLEQRAATCHVMRPRVMKSLLGGSRWGSPVQSVPFKRASIGPATA